MKDKDNMPNHIPRKQQAGSQRRSQISFSVCVRLSVGWGWCGGGVVVVVVRGVSERSSGLPQAVSCRDFKHASGSFCVFKSWTPSRLNDPFTGIALRPSENTDVYIKIHNRMKITVMKITSWLGNHHMRSCIKGRSVGRLRNTGHGKACSFSPTVWFSCRVPGLFYGVL